jgi:hypothetical protein
MRYLPPSALRYGTALAVLAFASCGEREEAVPPPPPPPTQGAPGVFVPHVNQSWTYAGTRDFPPGSKFSPADEDRVRNLPGDAARLKFERRRVCTGLYRPEGSDQEFTTFDIYEDGSLTEREIYDITADGVVGRGWAPAEIPLTEGVLLTPGVMIAVRAMAGGQSWSVASGDSGRLFQLQVIERTDITVPAGTFEAARLRITTEGDEQSTKRTVWFAENVGIVKEEVIHYDDNQIRIREQLELIHWVIPSLVGQAASQPPPPPAPQPGDAPEPASDPDEGTSSTNPLGYTQVSITTPLGVEPEDRTDAPQEKAAGEPSDDAPLPHPTGDTDVTPPEAPADADSDDDNGDDGRQD